MDPFTTRSTGTLVFVCLFVCESASTCEGRESRFVNTHKHGAVLHVCVLCVCLCLSRQDVVLGDTRFRNRLLESHGHRLLSVRAAEYVALGTLQKRTQ